MGHNHQKIELDPPVGLFDKIVSAIRREQEIKQTRKILFSFLFLLIFSSVAAPLSFLILANQAQSSGVAYFLSVAIGNINLFPNFWRELGLAILESLPVLSLAAFAFSLSIAVFTLRLFLHRKKLLLRYLTWSINLTFV